MLMLMLNVAQRDEVVRFHAENYIKFLVGVVYEPLRYPNMSALRLADWHCILIGHAGFAINDNN
jgi:hypothetical protein